MARLRSHGQTEIAHLTKVTPEGNTYTIVFMSTGKVLTNAKGPVGPSRGWKLDRERTDLVREFGAYTIANGLKEKGWQVKFDNTIARKPKPSKLKTIDELESEILNEL
jgi:hypothetical protein